MCALAPVVRLSRSSLVLAWRLQAYGLPINTHKPAMHKRMATDPRPWERRPLERQLIDYAGERRWHGARCRQLSYSSQLSWQAPALTSFDVMLVDLLCMGYPASCLCPSCSCRRGAPPGPEGCHERAAWRAGHQCRGAPEQGVDRRASATPAALSCRSSQLSRQTATLHPDASLPRGLRMLKTKLVPASLPGGPPDA